MKDTYNIKSTLQLLTIIIILSIIKASIIVDKSKKVSINFDFNEDNYEKNEFLRLLDFLSDSQKICNRASSDLTNYYRTGDLGNVKLYNFKNKTSYPLQSIIDLIDVFGIGNNKKSIKDYIIRHIAIVIIFFIIAIIAVAGWITCGICCCCCKCCCFQCCIISKCLYPFFLICTIMNLIVIICCIIGLVKTRSIFKGISNAECSILNFVNEGIEGESKITVPKWGGINNVIETLNVTINKIDAIPELSGEENYNSTYYKTKFKSVLINASDIIQKEQKYKYNYSSKNYIIDIAKEFGKYDSLSSNFTMGSYCDKWMKDADDIEEAVTLYYNLKEIIQKGSKQLLLLAISRILNLYDNLQDIKDLIGDEIVKYSDLIDKYGKLIFILTFTCVLIFTVITQILLIIYVCVCRGRTLLKILLHILWFILALLMVLVFLLGAFFILIGKFGTNILEMVEYLISKQNLESESPLLFDQETFLLNECINKEGDLVSALQLEEFFDALDAIKDFISSFDETIIEIILYEDNTIYESLIEEIEKRKNLSITNFGLVEDNITNYTSTQNLTLDTCVSNLNEEIRICSIDERWSFSCKTEYPELKEEICNITIGKKCMNPSTCQKDELSKKYNNSKCTKANELSKVINAIFSSVNFAANKSESNSIYNQAGIVNAEFISLKNQNEKILNFYKSALSPLIDVFDVFVGEHNIRDFLNCRFLGTDVRILLYYLYYKVAKDLERLAIILLICGLALGISISFINTIIIIVNKEPNTMGIVETKNDNYDVSNLHINEYPTQ